MESLTTVSAGSTRDSTNVDNHAYPPSFTRNEGLVYTALKKADRPMKAYELLELLRHQGLKAPMTIYRALEGLQEKSFAHKVVSQNAFVFVDQRAKTPYRAVVTCSRCGEARLVPLAENDVKSMFGASNMPISNVVIEAVGECDSKTCPLDASSV